MSDSVPAREPPREVTATPGWPPVQIPGHPGWWRHCINGQQVDLQSRDPQHHTQKGTTHR
ncbi:hypothetical protein RKD37_001722 [Streptomyces ambofaciens]